MNLEYRHIINEQLFAAPEDLAQRFSGNDNNPQKFRNMFMRDRDRVLYSKAFRRLSGKTQIYTTGKDDHQRNRLTHTLEVSQIATTIAQALGLNRDLAEAIALSHDLGHTPFGHAGEQALHMLMTPNETSQIKDSPFDVEDYDFSKDTRIGFKHNLQSVRMAVSLENIYGNAGLDLTNYALWGIQRHSSTSYPKQKNATKYLNPLFYDQYKKYYQVRDRTNAFAWSFEAFVVAEADEIAQLHHDLEDAIRGNAMTRLDVLKTIKRNLWGIMNDEDKRIYSGMQSEILDDESFIVSLSRVVVNTLVNTIICNSLKNLDSLQIKYDVSKDTKLNFFLNANPESDEIKKAISYCKVDDNSDIYKNLRKYSKDISTKVHNSFTVQRMNTKGQYVIRKLFQAYCSNPQQLPNHSIIQFLISVKEYQSKESAARALKGKGEGVVRTKFIKFWNSKKADPVDIKINLMRVICDHIASMTDSYALEEFKRLYN